MFTAPEDGPAIPAPEIAASLSRIGAFDGFNRSERLRRFLSYVVAMAMEGRAAEIKEYSLGVAVFDRPASFDPRMDTIVRVEARRLRQALENYYRGPGAGDAVVIELPKGGYVPVFRRRTEDAPAPASRPARRSWVAGAGVLALACAAGWAWFAGAMGGRVPSAWKRDGSTLTVMDSSGRVCWRRQLPPLDPDSDRLLPEQALLTDIDGDGLKELLFEALPQQPGRRSGSLMCFEQDGKLRWEVKHGRAATFQGRPFEPDYVGRLLRPVRVGGRPMVLSVANHYLWYPSRVVLIDARSGAVVDEYWHPGWIYQMLFADLDGDGQDEAVFGALNNPGEGLGHAAMGALKLPFSKAPPAGRVPGEPPPVTGGGEFRYLLFPLPDISRVTGTLPIPLLLQVERGGAQFLLQTGLWAEPGGLTYTVNAAFDVLECRASDNFAAAHARLRSQGLLDHALSAGERAALGRAVRFPWAPDGNSPEVNRRFAE